MIGTTGLGLDGRARRTGADIRPVPRSGLPLALPRPLSWLRRGDGLPRRAIAALLGVDRDQPVVCGGGLSLVSAARERWRLRLAGGTASLPPARRDRVWCFLEVEACTVLGSMTAHYAALAPWSEALRRLASLQPAHVRLDDPLRGDGWQAGFGRPGGPRRCSVTSAATRCLTGTRSQHARTWSCDLAVAGRILALSNRVVDDIIERSPTSSLPGRFIDPLAGRLEVLPSESFQASRRDSGDRPASRRFSRHDLDGMRVETRCWESWRSPRFES